MIEFLPACLFCVRYIHICEFYEMSADASLNIQPETYDNISDIPHRKSFSYSACFMLMYYRFLLLNSSPLQLTLFCL